jgi:pyruvate-ferredoxin/flavodoxin oxidoreductase
MLAMSYGHPYVARVAVGAKDAQTVNAFKEADSYSGVSVIVAYAHCIAHGYDLAQSIDQQNLAVDSAYWPLFRYDPRRVAAGESPLKMDSPAPKIDLSQFVQGETRFKQVEASNPEGFKKMMAQAQKDVREKYALYEQLAKAMNPANLVPGGNKQ